MKETWIRINYKNTPLMRIELMHTEKKPLGWKVFAEADRWESPGGECCALNVGGRRECPNSFGAHALQVAFREQSGVS